MAHNEHNKPKRSGSFMLIIAGSILLMLAPIQYPTSQELGILALIGGLILGGIGFYIKFVKGKKSRKNNA